VEGFSQEGLTAWFTSFGPTFNQFTKDPWLLLAAPITIPMLMGENTAGQFSETAAWGDTYNDLQGYLGAMGPGYDAIVGGLLFEMKTFGWTDGAKFLGTDSVLSKHELAVREGDFAKGALADGIYVGDTAIAPTSVEQLLLSGGQLDTMGAKDEAVIRVVESGDPNHPTFTLIMPSTQYWAPWGSNDPNDLLGNLNIMMGLSSSAARYFGSRKRVASTASAPLGLVLVYALRIHRRTPELTPAAAPQSGS
jgi:hypothetical protein